MTLRSTEGFRREHGSLLDQVERLPVVAHELPSLAVKDRIETVERVVAFLAEILLPHTEAEQQILYPGAERLLGDDCDSGAVAHDRAEIRSRIAELAAADPADPGGLQEILYALHALLAIHLQHEAEVYLKLVQSQPEEPVRRLFRRVSEHSPDLTPAA
jgi:iron-sulfur cluster repair protein YtfE (RIC family)